MPLSAYIRRPARWKKFVSRAASGFHGGRTVNNIVYFDLETQKSADEVGGWDNIVRMGLSVA